jgi:hypothetical protein
VKPSAQYRGPTVYRIRMAGHLQDHWANWFSGLVLHHESDGTTTLTGPIEDQAQLHGLLARVRDLGVTLISVQALAEPGRQPQRARSGTETADGQPVLQSAPESDEPDAADSPQDGPGSDR